jgi:hypothetical protein
LLLEQIPEVLPMTVRYLYSGVAAIAIVCGFTIGAASGQQLGRDGGLLPAEESGMVTVAGCLMRGDQIRGGDDDKYVLANVRKEQITSVPEPTCSADADATAVQLDNPKKGNVDDSMLGRWVEISGRLERETSDDDILRELDVLSARLLPVDAPRAAAEPAFEPPAVIAAAPEPEPAPEPIPVATSGQLPTTASFGPLAGLIGLFACGGALVLRSSRRRLG